MVVSQAQIWDAIKSEAKANPYMRKITQQAHNEPGAPYSWKNGLVYYKNRVVLAPNSPTIHQLLQEFHDSTFGGHSGVLRTYKEYVSSCQVCQRVKVETLSPAGLLQHCLFHATYGMILPWTLLIAFHLLMAKMLSSLL